MSWWILFLFLMVSCAFFNIAYEAAKLKKLVERVAALERAIGQSAT